MFVTMRSGASEADVLGVMSRILAEGLTPYEHARVGGLAIAVVRERFGSVIPSDVLDELEAIALDVAAPRTERRAA